MKRLLISAICAVAALPAFAQAVDSTAEAPGLQMLPVEELVRLAMSNNAAILHAQEQVRLAEAKLERVRLTTTLAVTQLAGKLDGLQAKVGELDVQVSFESKTTEKKDLERLQAERQFVVDQWQELRNEMGDLLGANAAVAEVSAESSIAGQAARESAARPKLSAQIAEQLETPVDIEFADIPIGKMATVMQEMYAMNIVCDPIVADTMISLNLHDVPIGEAFRAIAESTGDICFVFRDYGVFVTTLDRASTINAAAIPEDAPLLLPAGVATASPTTPSAEAPATSPK